jgi:catechol 2,3-dioxygenase-like lactoylglutathione lyase family enzyme
VATIEKGNPAELPTGILKPIRLAHFVVKTTDLAASKAWYMKLLDPTVAFENEMCCFITYDEEHHRVGIVTMPGLVPPLEAAVGFQHVAFTYADLPSLLSTYRRLRGLGILPFWTINHGPTISLYYQDPNGANIELQHDVFDTPEGVQVFFDSGAYEENCVGVIIDPEDMARKLESGVPVSELVVRPKLPEGVDPWSQTPGV